MASPQFTQPLILMDLFHTQHCQKTAPVGVCILFKHNSIHPPAGDSHCEMRELVHIQSWQGSKQAGHSFWEVDHAVDPARTWQGVSSCPVHLTTVSSNVPERTNVWCNETTGGRFVPCVILVSLDAVRMDSVHDNSYGQFFCPANFTLGAFLLLFFFFSL